MTMVDWSTDEIPVPVPAANQVIFELAKELFVVEGGNKPPHRCINDAMIFMEEWRAFLGMSPARPEEGSGNLRGES